MRPAWPRSTTPTATRSRSRRSSCGGSTDTAKADVRGRRLRRVRRDPDRDRGPAHRQQLPVRRPRDGGLSLRDNADEITEKLSVEIAARVAGGRRARSSSRGSPISPTPRRSPRRCCAASRPARSSRPGTQIVEGAVGMVELALDRLAEQDIVELDEERKAAMVSATCWSCCAAIATRSRSSTPARSTSERPHVAVETQEDPAAAGPGRPRRAGPVGGRRSAQHQRPDRVPAAAGAGRRRPAADRGR